MKKRSSLWFMVLCWATGLGGCVEQGVTTSLVVVGNKAINAACEADTNETGMFITRGVLDLVMAENYTVRALLKNQMQSNMSINRRQADGSDLRVPTNNITLDRAVVSYQVLTMPQDPVGDFGNYEVRASGVVSASDGTTVVEIPVLSPGEGFVAEGLSEALGTREPDNPFPKGELLVNVTFHGFTLDGSPITSNTFSFPLEVCKGCLLQFPQEAAVEGNPNCRNTANPADCDSLCEVGQDVDVDCRCCRQQKAIAERNDCEPL